MLEGPSKVHLSHSLPPAHWLLAREARTTRSPDDALGRSAWPASDLHRIAIELVNCFIEGSAFWIWIGTSANAAVPLLYAFSCID